MAHRTVTAMAAAAATMTIPTMKVANDDGDDSGGNDDGQE